MERWPCEMLVASVCDNFFAVAWAVWGIPKLDILLQTAGQRLRSPSVMPLQNLSPAKASPAPRSSPNFPQPRFPPPRKTRSPLDFADDPPPSARLIPGRSAKAAKLQRDQRERGTATRRSVRATVLGRLKVAYPACLRVLTPMA